MMLQHISVCIALIAAHFISSSVIPSWYYACLCTLASHIAARTSTCLLITSRVSFARLIIREDSERKWKREIYDYNLFIHQNDLTFVLGAFNPQTHFFIFIEFKVVNLWGEIRAENWVTFIFGALIIFVIFASPTRESIAVCCESNKYPKTF